MGPRPISALVPAKRPSDAAILRPRLDVPSGTKRMRPGTGARLAPKAGITPAEREANSRLKAAEKAMDIFRTRLGPLQCAIRVALSPQTGACSPLRATKLEPRGAYMEQVDSEG